MNNNIPNKKNELKIMQNPGRKSETKPKPILQIMSSGNKSNFSKKLSENNLPHINGFSLEDNNNKDEALKNNFGCISKCASMIVNNNNQDISFISNTKETENLLEINDNYNNYNANNEYIMMNQQLSFISEKNNKNNNNINISYLSNKNNNSAKKFIKIEYYDSQPVTFEILSETENEENFNEIKLYPYKMFRVEEMQFIKENKEKEENKYFNNYNGNNKKKKRRRKKK